MNEQQKARIVELADAIEGTDAAGVLTGTHYNSFCTGADRLIALGLWDNEGQESREVPAVKRELSNRAEAFRIAQEPHA